MSTRTRKAVLTLIASTLLIGALFVGISWAQTQTAEFTGLGPYAIIYSRYYGGNALAGILEMEVDGVTYDGFCIDLYTPIQLGNELLVNGALSEDEREAVDWCAVNNVIQQYADSDQTNEDAAAHQAAIWYFTSAAFGPYDGSGKYQFMTDPADNCPNCDASPYRQEAIDIINVAVPDAYSTDGYTATECTTSFPVTLTLEPQTAEACQENTQVFTATVTDQNGDVMEGVGVTFDPGAIGSVDPTTGTTDSSGQVATTFTSTLQAGDSGEISAYATGNYGTLLYDEGGNIQALSTITLLPNSIGDAADPVCEAAPGLEVQKYVSSDGSSWVDADTPPGLLVPGGSEVHFKFVVTNTGNVTVTSVSLNDSVFDLTDCGPYTLTEGASEACIITDTAELTHTNIVTASGTYSETTVTSQEDPANYTSVYTKAGYVFEDLDADGDKDGNEPGIEDVTLFLCIDCSEDEAVPCSTTRITTTDASGYYEFSDVPVGSYVVSVVEETPGNADDYNETLYERYLPVETDEVTYKKDLGRTCIFFSLTDDELDNNFGFRRAPVVGGVTRPATELGPDVFLLAGAAIVTALGGGVLWRRSRQRRSA